MAAIISQPFITDQQDDMEIADIIQCDADLDIDFDEPAQNFDHPTNEDTMQDDAITIQETEDIELRSATAEADDYMIDEASDTVAAEDDEVMVQDEVQPIDMDEELLDFSDDEGDNQPGFETHHVEAQNHVAVNSRVSLGVDIGDYPGSFEHAEGFHSDIEQKDEYQHNLDTATAQTNFVAAPAVSAEEKHTSASNEENRPHGENSVIEDVTAKSNAVLNDSIDYKEQTLPTEVGTTEDHHEDEFVAPNDNAEEPATEVVDGVDVAKHTEHPTSDAERCDQAKAESSPKSNASDGQHTKTGLHPTIVKYTDGQYALFPSNEPTYDEEYFLENENLASGSIADLLQACRSTLGEAIAAEEELELHVEDLGLYLNEDSTAAFSTSFSELLDIFVQLHRQDGNEQPPPMIVALTTRIRFANRLTLLANAVSEGKGFSDLAFLQPHEGGSEYEQADTPGAQNFEEEPEAADPPHQPHEIYPHPSGDEPDSWNHGETDEAGEGEAEEADTNNTASSRTLSEHDDQRRFDDQDDDERALLDKSGDGAKQSQHDEVDDEVESVTDEADTKAAEIGEKTTGSADGASGAEKVRSSIIADGVTDLHAHDENNDGNEEETIKAQIEADPSEQEGGDDLDEIDYSDYGDEPETLGHETDSHDAGHTDVPTPKRKRQLDIDGSFDADKKRARSS